jgi:hypothetical protein
MSFQFDTLFPLPLQVGASLPPGALLVAAALVVAVLSPLLFAVVVFLAYDEGNGEPSSDTRDSSETDRNPDRETDSDRDGSGTMI